VVLADPEDVQANLIGVLDLLDQVAEAIRWAGREAGVGVGRREAVDPDLQDSSSPCRKLAYSSKHSRR
jgi:hypothetical protein